jgi:hypothetical protein
MKQAEWFATRFLSFSALAEFSLLVSTWSVPATSGNQTHPWSQYSVPNPSLFMLSSHRCNRDCRRHGCRFPASSETASCFLVPVEIESIPLYHLNQNQSLATRYEVTKIQAFAMQAAGRGKFINHKRAFQLAELEPLLHQFVCSSSSDSRASISLSEIQANVGITPNSASPNEPPLRHLVLRAQQKINAIGRRLEGTYDPKAPLAFGSWPQVGASLA